MCDHKEFDAECKVVRLEDSGRFMFETKVKCSQCGSPMQFLGVPPGFTFTNPTVSLDGLELRVPITPQGCQPNPLQELEGYTIKSFAS